jgi:protoporphyrinogen oxidase
MDDTELVKYSLASLRRMFPSLEDGWVLQAHVWRALYSQPIVERQYLSLMPDVRSPVQGFYVATMAQIYPEDRGTNYAIREGVQVGELVASDLDKGTSTSTADLSLRAGAE